jgi:glycosyltransferase involved in cell wall biosynthesis
MRIDLHCHSKWSKRPTLWIMQKIGCPESFTEPRELYALARRKGMDWVTITDHNVIDGALEIQDLPNTFIGCEYTTYFPEDGCKVHVLVYGQTERQHAELTEARQNIYDLVRYVDENGLHTVCAHPLFWVNDRLTLGHVEQLILLFKNWELNGDMTGEMNHAIRQLCAGLTPRDIERLSTKHDYEPPYARPWEKNFTAGSDDHSSLHLADAYTEVPDADTLEDFWQGLEHGHATPVGEGAKPQRFARNVYAIAYQYYKTQLNLQRYTRKDMFLHFLEQTLGTRYSDMNAKPAWLSMFRSRHRAAKEHVFGDHSLFQFARLEAEKRILEDPALLAIVQNGRDGGSELDDRWFEFVREVSNRILLRFGEHVLDRVLRGQLFDLFHSLGSAGALYALLAPYFVSFSLFRREKTWSEEVLAHFARLGERESPPPHGPRVAHFTDTFFEVNGVAKTLQQHLAFANELEKDYRIITCAGGTHEMQRGLRIFKPVGSFTLPEYPEIAMLAPPFLHMLDHCYREGYTHIHVSTPGPVGLAGLGIARILQLPVSGTYHTAIPQYGKDLTGDSYVEDVLWRVMVWFYDQLDAVYVPSKATGEELIERGVSERRIRVYPRGCDIERFHPSHRNGVLQESYGIDDGRVNFAYVGRVSKEKDLHILAKAFRLAIERGANARLVVVGDGPYREELEQGVADLPVLFTGYVKGEALSELYASADALVFPSTTDTFGNVVLEAQASGIPVIVTDRGGPQENLLPGETGLVVRGKSAEELAGAIERLAGDAPLRQRMGRAAREYMAQRDFKTAFERLYAMYTEDKPLKAAATLDLSGLTAGFWPNEDPLMAK